MRVAALLLGGCLSQNRPPFGFVGPVLRLRSYPY